MTVRYRVTEALKRADAMLATCPSLAEGTLIVRHGDLVGIRWDLEKAVELLDKEAKG